MHRSSRGEVCTLPEFVMWPPARPPWQEAPHRSPAPAAHAAPYEVGTAGQSSIALGMKMCRSLKREP